MPVNIFDRRWLAAVDARRFAKGEGYKFDPDNHDFASCNNVKIVLRLRDARWYYWQQLVEERAPRTKKSKVSI